MPTLYSIKPAFQNLLRPLVGRLVARGATANQVTVAATVLSILAGGLIALFPTATLLFWTLPVVLFVRMALNAIDGMMAREFGQASKLGAYLNEIGDVISDVALILPFLLVAPFSATGVVAFAIAAILAEYAGLLGAMVGGGRAYDGPFGKSDRALALGIIAALIGCGVVLPTWFGWAFPLMALLSLYTMVNRIRAGLRRAAGEEGDHNG
ncbi:CDP-alcohol phosphatidyltransferase [Phyllobacterium brassicacearum]|uniref:CDP-alcohol phosphatidyltransferase n=1 Tax=Phyllobacterium brassicacearum TaxID=314235 RepID=A0A2P7BRH3_9HYPH|nr:CDP-alcohol phosphatidyltransferase family protein [Phyllobacterium brassicacearum]PSH69063.1 CDP-alcohol phosphatidyltransferase [Phyllobacterium brassicacearum]TDQ25313.1 CDP-diacylglycerol--glycerol-3-phosphate 3-phosphatidyltransferase [Phyllobacterium brassicacearum]